jgi:CrcB protein
MDRSIRGGALVAAGGFVGAVSRYAVDVGLAAVFGDVAGVATLCVNVVGSFALGVLVARTTTPQVRLFVGTGLIASFTTYSTFVTDAVALGATGGTLYVALSYGFGFAAATAGLAAGGCR